MLLLTSFLPLVLFGLVMPSFGEEPGWRGFALPQLQQQHGPLLGPLVLGAMHTLWHLPMFFTQNLGPFTVATFTSFILTGVAMTFIYTWMFNHTRGSVLLAILLHAAGNAASGLMNRLFPAELPLNGWLRTMDEGGWIGAIAFGLVALALVISTRGRLSYTAADAQRPM
jgi:membrane protease YdiL (CAAX protease family)